MKNFGLIFGVVRQLRYSEKNENGLDFVLFLTAGSFAPSGPASELHQ
jgi:hypothetical protein